MQALEDATPLIGGNLPIPKNVKCFGTKEGSRVWFNTSDYVGLFFAAIVWGLLLFAFVTMLQMYETIHDKGLGQDKTRVLSSTNFYVLCTFFVLACWSFFATMLGDPGSVPWNAHPLEVDKTNGNKLSICGHCDSYKPPFAHHDRVSGRCVSRMDHFCPWMNNAIGAGNQKNFLLFLAYTLIASLYFYVLLVQFLLHEDTNNEQSSVVAKPLLTMTRVLIFVLVFTILFTASMALNQIYGIRSGFGTIDRMKMGAQEVARLASPIPFSHVFGTFGIRWFLPLPPMHKHPEDVFRYTVKSYRFGRVV